MKDEYLKGRLTVHYGIDIVSLAHKVHGRVSFMELAEGDHLEVEVDDGWKIISVGEVLGTVMNHGARVRNWKHGQSYYEGSIVRVKLSSGGNKLVNSRERGYKINEILHYLKHGLMSHAEAAEALMEIDLEDD